MDLNNRVHDRNLNRIRTNIQRRNRRMIQLRKLGYMGFFLLIACITSAFCFAGKAKASSQDEQIYKYYTPYTVSVNDTLSEIVEDNIGLGYETNDELQKEIQFINHISDPNQIKAGETLIIPYYSYELF